LVRVAGGGGGAGWVAEFGVRLAWVASSVAGDLAWGSWGRAEAVGSGHGEGVHGEKWGQVGWAAGFGRWRGSGEPGWRG
jgi:hypothetical protein